MRIEAAWADLAESTQRVDGPLRLPWLVQEQRLQHEASRAGAEEPVAIGQTLGSSFAHVKLFYTSRMAPAHFPILTLIEEPAAAPAPAGRFRAARRPGERCEPIRIDVTAELHALEGQAAKAGLSLDLALTLCWERHRVRKRLLTLLEPREATTTIAALDAVAATCRIEDAVSPALAAYVRHLLQPSARTVAALPATDAVTVAMPARIAGDVTARELAGVVVGEDPVAARAWEIAAALQGMVIGEWAGWTALRRV
jgi:hypothetical protein